MSKLIQDVNIGSNLKRLRKEQNMTQSDICAHMDLMGRPMSQPTYAMIESGIRNIFVSDLIALKMILNVEFNELFAGLTPINKYEQKEQ